MGKKFNPYGNYHLPYVPYQSRKEIGYIFFSLLTPQIFIKPMRKLYIIPKVRLPKGYEFNVIFPKTCPQEDRITLKQAAREIEEFLNSFEEVKRVKVTSTPEGLLITVFFPESIDDETVDMIINEAYKIVREIERKNPDLVGQIFIGEGFE